MFAGKNDLVVEYHERQRPFIKDDVSWDYEGAAYYWQSDNDKDKVDTPVNPALTMENSKVVLGSNEQSWKAVTEDIGLTDAQRCISWPTTKDFSGYLHVVVWNEVGTCTQYVYKAEGAQKLTNLGVFNGADNGVAVFVTTPVKDADGKAEEKAYTATEDGNPIWVKQVNFDVQWDESALATWLKEWAKNQPDYQDTVQNGVGDSYDWDKFALASNGVVVTATVKAEDGKATEDKEVVSGQNSGQAKSFTLGGAVGEDGKNEISRNSPVQFTVTVSATVQKTTTTKNADGTTSESQPQPIDVKESFTTEKIPVYVQNYLNVPTVTAEAQVTANRGTANEKKEPIVGTDLKDGETYGWYNDYNNVLTSLKLTKCAGSTAPYTMSYELTRPDKTVKNGSLSSEDLGKDGKDGKDGLDAFKNFNDDGVYTLEVHATDAAGNESGTAAYTIKYDVSAPDVSAVFSLTSKDSPFYAEQRTIDIEVSDKLFKGSKNVTFEEGKPVSGTASTP